MRMYFCLRCRTKHNLAETPEICPNCKSTWVVPGKLDQAKLDRYSYQSAAGQVADRQAKIEARAQGKW